VKWLINTRHRGLYGKQRKLAEKEAVLLQWSPVSRWATRHDRDRIHDIQDYTVKSDIRMLCLIAGVYPATP